MVADEIVPRLCDGWPRSMELLRGSYLCWMERSQALQIIVCMSYMVQPGSDFLRHE